MASDTRREMADRMFQTVIRGNGVPQWTDEAAREFNFVSSNALRHYVRRYSPMYAEYRVAVQHYTPEIYANPHISVSAPYVVPDTYIYRGQPEPGLPIFTGSLQLEGDLMIVGDIHVPSTNWEFAAKVPEIALKHLKSPRRVAIVGDILNGDRDSRYDHIISPTSRQTEFSLTDMLLTHWATVFDEIYITPGNHLHRLMKKLEGDIGMNEIARLLTKAHDQVHMSHYDEVHINSGGQEWMATHQQNYSKLKLKVGNYLAQKYQKNIITFHQHHTALGRDDYNRYTVIDCGGLHQQNMMAYTSLVPNVMPNMCNGFVLMRDGVGSLLTPYPTITDWSMWA